jgi:hypothetical protein
MQRRRRKMVFFLFCLLGLVCGVPAHAQQAASPRTVLLKTVRLGMVHGSRIVCRIGLVRFGDNEDELWLTFLVSRMTGALRTFRVDVGECWDNDIWSRDYSVADYVGLGRKQVFAETSYGVTVSGLYDCDGTHVRKLYFRDEGRDGAHFVRGKHGGWRLAEYWRYDEYGESGDQDDAEMGAAFVVIQPKGHLLGEVCRMLHWNGRRFVPDNPGRTRILDRQGREEKLR